MAGIHNFVVGEGPEPAEQPVAGPSLWQRITQAGDNTSDGIMRVLRAENLTGDRLAKVMALPFSQF